MKWQQIDLPQFSDTRGNLVVVESRNDLPFPIRRVFFFFGMSTDVRRGKHAHYQMEEVVVAVQGRFKVWVDDGHTREVFVLDSPTKGLYLPPLVWRELTDFSEDAIGLALASTLYDEADYIREYATFLEVARGRHAGKTA